MVTFVIAGNTSDVNATAYSLCDSVLNGTSYSFNGYTLTLSPNMTVDNESYYGDTCGATVSIRIILITLLEMKKLFVFPQLFL